MTRPQTLRALSLAALVGAGLTACGPKPPVDKDTAPETTVAETPAMTPEEAKAVVAALPAPYNTGDVENGKTQFIKCKSCHSIAPDGRNSTGPGLYGVVGRKAGTHPGYAYSDALKAAGYAWDPAHLDPWLADPRGTLPGTKMSFIGLPDAKNRADLIAYLATQAPAKK